MKNLVLGALLAAAASSTACTSSSTPTDAVITARWSFTDYASNKAGRPADDPCPTNFDTAEVHAKEWDPVAGDFVRGGIEVIDKFDCSAKEGTTDPVDGVFLVWVAITNHSGSSVYAESESEFLDTLDGNLSVTLPSLFLDAGFYDLKWDLIDRVSQTRLSCRDAGATAGISTTAVAVSSNASVIDKFDCTDGFGFSDPLLAGTYDVTVTATGSGGDVGASGPIADVVIKAPNVLTHLGRVKVTIQ